MTPDLFNLRDRVIVVTGALGRLGRAFTRALCDRGARVAAIDLAEDARGKEALAEDVGKGRASYLSADVTERSSLEAALTKLTAAWGTPHGLVNNAGVDAPPDAPAEENGPFETYPTSSLERVLDVNTTGVVLGCQVFGGAMAEAGRGSIVNIGSIYGIVSPDQRFYEHRRRVGEEFFKPIAYSASKASLYGITRYLATYWASKNLRVNTVTFGGVFAGQDDAFVRAYSERVPLGRMASEADYIGPLVFLLSDASSYMTGANLTVDGGFTAW